MCHYITATMSADGDENIVRRLAKNHLLKWEPLENPSLKKLLLPGEGYFFTTRRMCDCGTTIGSAANDHSLPIRTDFSREIKKHRKKGWSEAKIDRWLQQRKSDQQRKQAEAEARQLEPGPEVRLWIEFVNLVVRESHASHIGLLLHWYSGGLSTENLRTDTRKWVGLKDLDQDYLLGAEEDVLHSFRR